MKKKIGGLFQYTPEELKKLLDKALSISDSSNYELDQELKEHSRAHNEWASLAAKANKLLNLEELQLKQTTAEVMADIRRRHVKEGKPLAQTFPIEKELVPLDERWRQAQNKVIELKEFVDILSGVERRFNNRCWLLIQLAKGKDGEFEPSVKGKKRSRQSSVIEMEEYEL